MSCYTLAWVAGRLRADAVEEEKREEEEREEEEREEREELESGGTPAAPSGRPRRVRTSEVRK